MVNIDNYINRSFFNPYLSSVAFEIRYPSSVRIIKDFSNFQDLINERYPNFAEEIPFFDISDTSKAPENLRKYLFSDDGEKNKVIISINALAIVTTDYYQFENFREQVDNVVQHFSNSLDIKFCLRMGLRYINIYPLKNDLNESITKANILFHPFYNTGLIPNEKVFSNNIEIRKQLPEDYKVTLRTRLQFNKAKKSYEHILDFDTYTNKKILIENYEDPFTKLKDYEKIEFLTFVTENFMEKMDYLD